jgi:hypothetical protein
MVYIYRDQDKEQVRKQRLGFVVKQLKEIDVAHIGKWD